MDVRGKKIQLFELMYYIPLGLFLAGGILLDSFYQVYGGPKVEIMICMVSILLLVIREIIFEEYGPADWTCLILTIFFFGLGVLIGSLYYASIFFMIFGGRNIPFRRIAKFALWLIIIVFVIVVVSAKLGIIRNYTSIESDRSNREYLGFLSALYPGNFLFAITGLALYEYREKFPLVGYLALGAADYWVYVMTNGRTSFYMTIILLLCGIVLKIWPHIMTHLRAVNFLLALTAPICVAVSFWLGVGYNSDNPQMFSLNTLVSGRLYYMHVSLKKFGMTAFGQYIPWVGHGLNGSGVETSGDYIYVDNMFIYFWQMYGWVTGALATVLIFLAMYHMYRRKKYYMLLIAAAFLLFGMMDNSMLKIRYNLFYIAMACELFGAGLEENADG